MNVAFIGLGKMGGNMVKRALRDGHEVVAWDMSTEAVQAVEAAGARGAADLTALVDALEAPRVVWMMVPAGDPVDDTIAALKDRLEPGDILIDGGNSNWRETQARGDALAEAGIHYLDCGTSGGVWGLDNGYCLMIGGDEGAYRTVEPLFKTLAPENGYLYCGPGGAGHFVKMVHNGIEYGMMQAYAEGFEIMEKSPFDIDLKGVADVWQHGSVVRSWLLELAARAFADDPKLSQIADYVNDSGEGRWTVASAIDFDVPAPVITMALFARFQSRQDESFANKVLAALRNQFGGHAVKSK